MLSMPLSLMCLAVGGAAPGTPAAVNAAFPAELTAAIRSADEVRFVTRTTQGSITTCSAVSPVKLLELAGLLAGVDYRDRGLAWCVTDLDVEFWQKGKRVGRISPLGAPDALRCQVGGPNMGDFTVGAETVAAFTTWVSEQLRVPANH